MNELLVIISAELILLASIAAMMIHNRRTDVLNRRGSNAGRRAASSASNTKRTRRPTGHNSRPQARATLELTRESPFRHQRRQREPIAYRDTSNGSASQSLERGAEPTPGKVDVESNAPNSDNSSPASLPPGVRIYAIGDIHGRSDLLRLMLDCIEADLRQRPVERATAVFIGDYIDRGPQSRDVIDLLLRWRENNSAIFLRGNHETLLPRFLSDAKTLDEWRRYGGLETLLSYGLQPSISPDRDEQERLADQLANALPREHFEFLESLEPFFGCGDFFFVHAGIRPGVPLDEQAEEDLLWIREEFLAHEGPFERFVIHGHTPVVSADFRSNRINIDTGAFATGHLTCIVIEGCDITQLPIQAEAAALSVP